MKFLEWARENEHTELVSLGRSGREWIWHLLEGITGRPVGILPEIHCFDNYSVTLNNYDDYLLFMIHNGTGQHCPETGKYILLVRDPRDAILSGAYYHPIFLDKNTTPEQLLDPVRGLNWWNFKVDRWEWLFEVYLPLSPLVIQYEILCLNPRRVLLEIIKFLGAEIVNHMPTVIEELDSTKQHERKGNETIPKAFLSPGERYIDHCLKWQRDPLFTEAHNKRVLNRLADIMLHWGYLPDGHNLNLFMR